MDVRIGGNRLRHIEVVPLMLQRRDYPTRLPDDDHAGPNVPGVHWPLPVPVEPATGHPAHVERRRAITPHPASVVVDVLPESELRPPLVNGVRKATRQQRMLERLGGGDGDWPAIHGGAAAQS